MKKVVTLGAIGMSIVVLGIVATVFGILRSSTLVTDHIPTEVLDHPPTIAVYQPPGYSLRFGTDYPVLYVLDGQAFIADDRIEWEREWMLSDTLDQLIASEQLDPMLVVAVYSDENRSELFAPFIEVTDHQDDMTQRYEQFIVDELKPYVDTRFRTKREAEFTAISGIGASGTIALHIANHHSDQFSKAGALHPTLIEVEDIQLNVNEAIQNEQRIWLDSNRIEFDLQTLLGEASFTNAETSVGEEDVEASIHEYRHKLVEKGVPENNVHIGAEHDSVDARWNDMLHHLYR